MNYYNEFDPKAAAWIRELIDANLIPPGTVDERSITDVKPTDLRGFTQLHFFAGVAGWPLALQIAGVPDTVPLWTGSCPCQPFSIANAVWKRGGGIGDERDLWPAWFNLMRQVPSLPTVFGEQIAGTIAKGWLDRAFDDMGSIGHTCGAAVLPALSVGSPQERMRLWFVCHPNQKRHEGFRATGENSATHGNIHPWSETSGTGTPYRGKQWLSKPGVRLLVDGLPGCVDWRCGALGNAIVAPLAAEFILASLEALGDVS